MFGFFTEGESENRIWFRQYEINKDGDILEIGPRMIMELISITEGVFSSK